MATKALRLVLCRATGQPPPAVSRHGGRGEWGWWCLQVEEGAPCLPPCCSPWSQAGKVAYTFSSPWRAWPGLGATLVLDSSAQPDLLLPQWGWATRPLPSGLSLGCSLSLSVPWPLFWMISPYYHPAPSLAVLVIPARPGPGAIPATLPLPAAPLQVGRPGLSQVRTTIEGRPLSPGLSGSPCLWGPRGLGMPCLRPGRGPMPRVLCLASGMLWVLLLWHFLSSHPNLNAHAEFSPSLSLSCLLAFVCLFF